MIVLLLLGSCGGKSTSEGQPPPQVVCTSGSATYRPGESFPDDDGCNTCTCRSDGTIGCTSRACGALSCTFHGVTYPIGTAFPDQDGCNLCTCEVSGVTCTQIGCNSGCNYGGRQYAVGQSFPADDTCNTCNCQEGGPVLCTTAACPPPECRYLGSYYRRGSDFPARDGCNRCQCVSDSSVACTEEACPCDPDAEWWRRYVSGSPEECATITIGCPAGTTIFENDCGCGCEQDSGCGRTMEACPRFEGCVRCPFTVPSGPD